MRALRNATTILVCLATCGCLVRSLHPWFGPETRVNDIRLAGPWYDEDQKMTAVFREQENLVHDVVLVPAEGDPSRVRAEMHRLEGVTLMVVAPAEREDLEAFTLLPGHMLFRVEFEDERMLLFGLDLETFGQRLAASPQLLPVAESSKDNGFVLGAATPALTAFLKSQLGQRSLFRTEPYYRLRRATIE